MKEIELALCDAMAYGGTLEQTLARTGALLRNNPDLLRSRLPGNNTPLLLAAYAGSHELVELVLSFGAELDLISAVVLGRTDSVKTFLSERPAFIHKRSPRGWPLLHLAAQHGDLEIVRFLLSAGADPNSTHNENRLTPLFLAFRAPHVKAELLLEHGANVHARDKHRAGALHYAASTGNEAWLDFLLAHGADPKAETNARQTPWTLAVRYKHHKIADKLTRAMLSSC